MNAGTKSLIRHILTALGVLLAAVGMADASDLFNTLLVDLDGIWDAILVITGLVTTVVGFFTKRKEVEAVEE
jgi:Zn-dependent protease with chaperone function